MTTNAHAVMPPTSPPPRTLDEDMAELLSYGTAALAPTIQMAKEHLARAATLWVNGVEPIDFDLFFEQVNEMPLFPASASSSPMRG